MPVKNALIIALLIMPSIAYSLTPSNCDEKEEDRKKALLALGKYVTNFYAKYSYMPDPNKKYYTEYEKNIPKILQNYPLEIQGLTLTYYCARESKNNTKKVRSTESCTFEVGKNNISCGGFQDPPIFEFK